MDDSVPDGFDLVIGGADASLSAELELALTAFNMAATGVSEELSFSVKVTDTSGELVGGLTGWIWGATSGINLVWIREANRREGWGARLLSAAEHEVRRYQCQQIFVSSFTFQAPDFYRNNGYREIARVPGLLADGVEDVWFVKVLA
jgi:GNAT superfamily N-acetyltransferase